MPGNKTLFSKTSKSKVNPRGSPKTPQQQPTFDRGKKSENKTNHCLSPAKQPHLPAANIKPKVINSARIKAKMKPPAHYEFKPIYKHFQRKVLHPDSKTATNKVVQTEFCDQVTNTEQAQDQPKLKLKIIPSRRIASQLYVEC